MRITGSLLAIALAAFVPSPDDGNGPKRIAIGGIENTFRLSPRLYSGGDPRGAEGLQALKKLGIRTIISVDGAAPDVEAARILGLRYVHLPVGYDGIPREQAVKLIRALQSLPGPFYVHCHHGKHRGPAAAALCGISAEGWSKPDALAWMATAGTSADYRGLYESASKFETPTAEELGRVGDDLPELAEIPAIVDLMVRVDERWDCLKASQTAGFRAPPNRPDIDPPHEALQLVELYRELARLPEAQGRGPVFLKAAEAAGRDATALEEALRYLGKAPNADATRRAETAFQAASKACAACHSAHRDAPR
ncbi:MAG: hypothetical protein U0800_14190 [Isosphaeraceae bacterium]